jgi:hypothetical protein
MKAIVWVMLTSLDSLGYRIGITRNGKFGCILGIKNTPTGVFSIGVNLFFLFGFLGDHFAAFIVTAIGANSVRQTHLTAVAASYQVARLKGIVRPAAITTTLGQLSLWLWGHGLSPESINKQGQMA